MRILLFLTIFPLVMASISPLVGEKTKAMTPERILELWNLPVKNGDIPEGFNNWMISNQSKVTIEISLPNGEKFNPPPFKMPQKIIQGKYIMWLVAPPGLSGMKKNQAYTVSPFIIYLLTKQRKIQSKKWSIF